MEIVESEVEDFIRGYVNALNQIVGEKRKQIESTNIVSSFPTEFPVKATVYLIEKGLLVHFDKSNNLDISIKKGERPAKKSKWSEFIPYRFFQAFKDKPEKKAESDVKNLLELPGMIKANEEAQQDYYNDLWIESLDLEVEHFLGILNKAGAIVEKTKEEAIQEVHAIITSIQTFLINYEYYLRVGCNALDRLYFIIEADIETSLFLALHGKYMSAMAQLRKVLEMAIRCIYLDSLKEKNEAETKLESWIEGEKIEGFGFRSSMNKILADSTDESLTNLLNKLNIFETGSFKQKLISLYEELCAFVHLRPKAQLDYDSTLLFPEFNKDLWSYYYNTFTTIAKAYEILLVFKFPKIVDIKSIVNPSETYVALHLSEQQLAAIIKFSTSAGQ